MKTKRLAVRSVFVFVMKGLRLKNRFSRCAKDRPPSLGPVDFEIRVLGGGTTSTLLFHELPPKGATTHQNRIAELHEEIRCLSNEVAYYKALTDEALSRILPVVQFHARDLHDAVQRCNAKLDTLLPERYNEEPVDIWSVER